MEHDDWQMYLDVLKEQRKTDREREIERELQQIAAKHRDALVAESEPLYKELAAIEARKPPLPINIDGKIFEYVGPRR
jgi:hypothetical protein